MKKSLIKTFYLSLIIILLHIFSVHNKLSASGRIALVKGSYDSVDTVLKNYRVPYESISLQDLHDIKNIKKYTAIFLPSGVEVPLHKKINLVATGTRIKSVKLNSDALKTDEKRISRNIKTFIENGGSVYLSGYSYRYLQLAYHLISFFNNFPYMGMPGRIITENRNDLYRFSLDKRSPLYITYPGWVAVKSADNVEILSTASFQTPRGEKNGIISFIMRRGAGEALFTSYYSTVFSSFRRFNIYRIAGSHLMKKQHDESLKYQQEITGRIVDSLMGGEISRTYRFNLKAGNNTLSFTTESSDCQLDIFDREMALMLSVGAVKGDYTFNIESPEDSLCYARVYPLSKKRYGIFSLMSASGERYFPYYKTTAVIASIVLLLAVVFTFIYLFGGKKYSGRPKMIN